MSAEDDQPPKQLRPLAHPGDTYAKRDVQVLFVMQVRKAKPFIKYADLLQEVMRRFRCSQKTAQRSMTAAAELMQNELREFAATAAPAIVDAYVAIHDEAVRDRRWREATLALDSMRDMMGLKAPTQVYVSPGIAPAVAQHLADLSDDELAILAKLDQSQLQEGNGSNGLNGHGRAVIDVLDPVETGSE